MGPRTELALAATLSGAGVTAAGSLAASLLLFDQLPGEALRTAVGWSPTGALAGLAASLLLVAWQSRAGAGHRWRPAGLAARAVGLALLCYPACVAAWFLATGGVDPWQHGPAMSGHELLRWLPSVVLGATLAALLAGTLPAYALAFLLGRRYLRRQARAIPDPA